ncbi:MAG: anti-CBASS Acb1 family protein [Candidatus Paceibacterota bacterium]|jgi:hypothetical protein
MANHRKKKAAVIKPTGKNIVTAQATSDSFVNLVAKLGIQADNQSSNSYYALGPFLSRDRLQLEAAYRSSWLVGAAVDSIAEDMTRAGVTFHTQMDPGSVQKMNVALSTFGIWSNICSGIKWARLYGGAVAIILVDGADYTKPLNIEAIGKDKFKGLVVMDRWMVQPSFGELITDICQDIGKPKFYEVLPGVSTFPAMKIHYTRVMRFDGIELPYYQKLFENLWGLSVVERIYDRLLAFDSSTTGAAQLLYRAHLRVVQIDGLREALAAGGKTEAAVLKMFQYIRQLQSMEGITLLDGKDQFTTHQYTFGGVSDILIQFGQQISGATGIPLVRLFGQSPAGLSSTGESDLRNYYDNINRLQENQLRPELDKLFAIIARSKGLKMPSDLEFLFNPLWQLSDTEKSTIAANDSGTISGAESTGLIKKSTALKELRQLSRVTGRFTNITDEDIEDAENEPPPAMPGMEGQQPPSPPNKPEEGDPNASLGADDPKLTESKEQAKVEKNPEGKSIDKRSRVRDVFKKFLDIRRRVWDAFKEEEHPREETGKFTSKGGGVGKKQEESESKPKGSKQPQTDDEKNLYSHIKQVSDFYQKNTGGAGGKRVYDNTYDLVSKEGKFFKPAPLPKDVKKGKMKGCYRNAALLAMENDNYTYCEGIAYSKAINGFPFNHAFCIDKEGNVVDPTWKDGTAYFGVPFSTDFLRKTIVETGIWGLIPDYPSEKYNPFEAGFPKGAIVDEDEEDDEGTKDSNSLSKEELEKIKDPEFDEEHYHHVTDDFKESEHPRGQPENAGQFTSKGGGTISSKKESKPAKGMTPLKEGKAPVHIAKLKIPPAWTDITYNPDPKAELLVKGKDAAGRTQYVYSEKHWAKAASKKFGRIEELNKKFDSIMKENDKALKQKKEEALVLSLIMQTGIRPGSSDEIKGKVKAYGATTLEGQHVEATAEEVFLHFIGKKGVENKIPIEDKTTAKILVERAKKAGKNGKLFDTDGGSLLKYTASLDGGKFKTKDFRTLLGTKTAKQLIDGMEAPKNEKEYKKQVKSVAKQVAERLGNTPSVALKSYISPVVFSAWRISE